MTEGDQGLGEVVHFSCSSSAMSLRKCSLANTPGSAQDAPGRCYLSKKLFPMLKEKSALKQAPSPIPPHRITCMADHHPIVPPK